MITAEHFQEIVASGVAPPIIKANFESLYGNTAIEAVAGDYLDSLGGDAHQYVTAPVKKVLSLYDHLTDGGWWCSGLDPLNNWERMSWGQFKPDQPRASPEDPEKTIKYEGQYQVEARATFLDDPSRPQLWPEVLDNASVPIHLMEGSKKSGLMLTLGHAAIALPGIWMGRRKGPERLIPELELFAQPGREFVFVFDADEKRKTRSAVAKAIRATARLLEAKGCTVRVARWLPALGKGIDDVWASGGVDKVHELLSAASPLGDQQQLAQLNRQQRQEQPEQDRQAWLALREAQARASWQKLRTYTPTAIAEQRYVSVEIGELRNADIHALKSGMGTGKTHALTRILNELGTGAIAIGSRNSLLLQSCERWGGFYHLHQDSAHGLTADPDSRIACCLDSLIHFRPQHFDGKVVILDEVLSIVKHGLTSSTLKGKRSECLARFTEAIRRAAVVIAWDGNNADIAINYLVALRGPDAKVIKQLNRFRGDRLRVELVQSVNEGGDPLLRDRSPVERKLMETLETARHLPEEAARAVVVISDSQIQCQALDDKLAEAGYRTLRVDSKTLGDDAVGTFLQAPNAYLQANPVDALIMSPTAESGIDISIKDYFVRGYAFFCGIIDTDTQMQFLRRTRACLDWSVWCQAYTVLEEWEGTRSPFARRLQAQILSYLQMDAAAVLAEDERAERLQGFIRQLLQQTEDPHTQATLKFMAARNFERSHTRECLAYALTEAGHQVQQVNLHRDQGIEAAMKTAHEDIKDANSSAIFHSRSITTTEALSIKASFSASLEDRYAAERALLIARLPGVQNTGVWSVQLVKRLLFTERRLVGQLERYWMLRHMGTAKARSRHMWAELLDGGAFFVTDIQSEYSRLQALESLGLLEILDGGEQLTANSKVVQDIYKRCRRKQMQTALGRAPSAKKTPMEWIGRLMASIAVTSRVKMSRRDQKGDRYRQYLYVAPEADEVLATILDCFNDRFEKYLPQATPSEAKAIVVDHQGPSDLSNLTSADPDSRSKAVINDGNVAPLGSEDESSRFPASEEAISSYPPRIDAHSPDSRDNYAV